jgi:hypothetical protein
MKIRMAMSVTTLLLVAFLPTLARAQSSSTHFKLVAVAGSGGLGTSTNYRLFSDLPRGPAGRSAGANNSVFAGFVRAAGFSPLDTLRFVTTGGKFTMISLPLKEAVTTPTSVLSVLGGYDNTKWRFGRWDTATNKYLEPGSGLTAVRDGLGYWLITRDSYTNVRVVGLPQPSLAFVGLNHEYPLANGPGAAPGWNQMGNPFQYPIDVSHVFVTDFSTYAYPITAGGNTVTDPVAKTWNPATSQYVNATTLNGREGFWVHKLVTTDVYVVYQAGASGSGTPSPDLLADASGLGGAMGRAARSAPASQPASAQWSISITGQQGESVSEPMLMGAAPVASGTWNSLCRALAPSPPGLDMLTLRQTRTDWGRMSGDYTSVFQPQAENMSWDFSVSGAESPGELALAIDSQGLPAGTRLWLTDRATGARQELPAGGAITVPAYAGSRDYRVEAIGGTAQQPAANLGDGFVRTYPNPFRATTGLSFSLARGGDVSVDIFDLQGRRVRFLERRGLAAGEHVLVWDGKDEGGNLAGSGVYLTRWRAGGLSGSGRLVKID